MFFMDILQKYVFDEKSGMPDEAIVNILMSFSVSKHLPGDKEGVKTRQFSPYAGFAIDANPTIRSFLLQLILHSQNQQVRNQISYSYFFVLLIVTNFITNRIMQKIWICILNKKNNI